MKWGSTSPLFRQAAKAIRQEAEKEFYRTTLGKAVKAMHQAERHPSPRRHVERFDRAMKKYKQFGLNDALSMLSGTTVGQLARDVERYQKGGMEEILQDFFKDMGPVGRFISALMGVKTAGGKAKEDRSVERLIDLTEALGFPVLRPGAKRTKAELEAMAEELRLHGYTVGRPGEENVPPGAPKQQTAVGIGRRQREPAEEPATIEGVQYPPTHPIVTGEMVKSPNSSNVHSFGYQADSRALFVRFVRGKPPGQKTYTKGPGSLYRYDSVTPAEFLSILSTESKGGWVWDHLRIRGAQSGHQKQYALVGIVRGYVPRQATVGRTSAGQLREQYVPRRIWGADNKWHQSLLPQEWLPDTGAPDTGAPNTGAL